MGLAPWTVCNTSTYSSHTKQVSHITKPPLPPPPNPNKPDRPKIQIPAVFNHKTTITETTLLPTKDENTQHKNFTTSADNMASSSQLEVGRHDLTPMIHDSKKTPHPHQQQLVADDIFGEFTKTNDDITNSSFPVQTNIADDMITEESSHSSSTPDITGPTLDPYCASQNGSCPQNPFIITTPQHYVWPAEVISTIRNILSSPDTTPSKSKFLFEISTTAANHNRDIIMKFDNLGEALDVEKSSFTAPGSEFRTTSLLAPLLKLHLLWQRFSDILDNGIKFPLSHLDDVTMQQDLSHAIAFGNHKGVQKHPECYDDLNHKDVAYGYSIPIPITLLHQIQGAAICPMNIVEQYTISESGEIIDKQRPCHDLSFPHTPSNTSVNSRVDKNKLQDCMFGHCLLRLIHYISALRAKFPTTSIFIQKVDWKSAYRRAHMHWSTSIQCCSITKEFALIPLRAVFGGTPCPAEWSVISETVTDLANMLLNHPDWDPSTLHSPLQHKIDGPSRLQQDVPFAPAHPMMVPIPLSPVGCTDVYIDDTITVSLDGDDNNKRAEAAVPLAIHIVGRPVAKTEPIKRQDLLSLPKLEAEGRLEEIKNVLGWDIDTRRFTISLPIRKYDAWKTSIISIISTKITTFRDLDTLIGRLNHISVILPQILHFMGRLRILSQSATKRRKVKLKPVHIDDLELCLQFLHIVKKGVNLNLITFRQPTHVYFSDACPAGIGGYNSQGNAWRWYIPKHLQFRATINMLEHISSIVGPWIDIIHNRLPPLSCILAMTDSTTSSGWLRKSNFHDSGDTKSQMNGKLRAARSHALRMIKHQIREYSQWFPGRQNHIADSLSRDFDLLDSELISLYRSKFNSQLHQRFNIAPLPQKIASWICSWLQKMSEQPRLHEAHQTSALARGIDGPSFSSPSICPLISIWTPCHNVTKSTFSQPSLMQYDELNSQTQRFLDWV